MIDEFWVKMDSYIMFERITDFGCIRFSNKK